MRQKKIPMRKCVVTGEQKPKNELIRIVRATEGDVAIDLTGKKNGRGVYLHLTPEVVALAQKKNMLSRHLEVDIPATIYEELIELATKQGK
ncbi:MAG: RNase P modulator RnpM [Turicibacter sp.]